MIGKKYIYMKDGAKCMIFDLDANYLGSVSIDGTNAYTPHYEEGVTYLPINSALKIMGYKPAESVEIE